MKTNLSAASVADKPTVRPFIPGLDVDLHYQTWKRFFMLQCVS